LGNHVELADLQRKYLGHSAIENWLWRTRAHLQVKKDLRVFKGLLEQHLQPLADYRPRPATTALSVRAAAFQQANHAQRHAHAAATAQKQAYAAWWAANCTGDGKEAEYAARVAEDASQAAAAAASSAKRAAELSEAALAKQLQLSKAVDSPPGKHTTAASKATVTAQRHAKAATAEYSKVAGTAGIGPLWLRKARGQLLHTAHQHASWLWNHSLVLALRNHSLVLGVRKLLPRRRLHLPASLQSSLPIVVFVDDLDRCKPSKVCARLACGCILGTNL
jgi:hypothetical protein